MTIDHTGTAEALLIKAGHSFEQTRTTGAAADLACVADAHIALARLQFDRAQAILEADQRRGVTVTIPRSNPILVPSADQIRQERDELIVEIDVLLDRKRQLDNEIATARETIARLRRIQADAVTAVNRSTARLYGR